MALESSSADSGISRRTIVKGAAWAAPVMIAAVAVPAAVASTNALTGISRTNPTTATLPHKSSVSVTLTVTPAFTGTVYLALAALDSQDFYFGATGTATTAAPTFVNGVIESPIVIRTPNGSNKRATLSASSLPSLAGAVTLTLRT